MVPLNPDAGGVAAINGDLLRHEGRQPAELKPKRVDKAKSPKARSNVLQFPGSERTALRFSVGIQSLPSPVREVCTRRRPPT